MKLAIVVPLTILLGAFYGWTSRINGLFFFGRTVGPDLPHTGEGRAITRAYLLAILAITAVAVLTGWGGSHLGRSFAAAGLLVEIVGFSFVFANANKQVRALERSSQAAAAQETVVQVNLLEPPSYWIPGLGMVVLPAVLGVGSALLAVWTSGQGGGWSARWQAWSDQIDAHRWDMLLGMCCGVLAASTALLLVFRYSARLRTSMAQYTVRAGVAMEWLGVGCLMAVLACNAEGLTLSRATGKSVIVAVLGITFALMIWNQSRSKRFVPPSVEMGADDRWRWGLFYVDRSDPALFVQSRCGAGYTLNFGKVLAWPIALAMWAYFVAMLFFAPHH